MQVASQENVPGMDVAILMQNFSQALTLANKPAQDEMKRTLEAFSNFIKKVQAQQEAQAKENKELKERLIKTEAALKDNKTAHDAEIKAKDKAVDDLTKANVKITQRIATLEAKVLEFITKNEFDLHKLAMDLLERRFYRHCHRDVLGNRGPFVYNEGALDFG